MPGEVQAQEQPTDDTQAVAAQAGVDALDLQGAVNTTGLKARDYLVGVDELPRPQTSSARVARVRLTYYVEEGRTYGGGTTFPGSTACSWNFPLGTRFALPDGEVFVCNDRGLLGSSGWLDLWRRPDLVRRYGSFVTVRVL